MLMSAPISRSTSIIPERVGLRPTFITVTSLSGITEPRTRKNAADEISPGTRISCARNESVLPTVILSPSTSIFAPIAFSISSVWSRDFISSWITVSPSAKSAARISAVLT